MSKKRKYYVKNDNKRKSGALDLRYLEKGVLMSVTVDSRCMTAYREMVEILTSDLFNENDCLSSAANTGCKSEHEGLEPTGNIDNFSNNNDIELKNNKNLSIAEQIELESRAVSKEAGRFELIGNISTCLSIIKFNDKKDVPSLMIEKLMEKVHDAHVKTSNSNSGCDARISMNKEKKNSCSKKDNYECGFPYIAHSNLLSSRFISRLLPLDAICSTKVADIKKMAVNFVKSHFKHAYCAENSLKDLNSDNKTADLSLPVVSWACFFSSRYSGSNIMKHEIYDLFTELIWGPENDTYYHNRRKLYPVNLEKPEKAVIVEIVRHICGISILRNYNKYLRYNLNKLLNQ
ncbi:hypothetical protein FG386_002482 [Cryptosporidium ryanae]|uniref:uncharacterized protein n=1 Tax=Cryptosporidium ryanae TaxID=515981 RepID=UPI00351A624A|nr:hypothetical protein FG386_002482 [Cryptosporidium ryanae]